MPDSYLAPHTCLRLDRSIAAPVNMATRGSERMQLKMAMELSLRDSQSPPSQSPISPAQTSETESHTSGKQTSPKRKAGRSVTPDESATKRFRITPPEVEEELTTGCDDAEAAEGPPSPASSVLSDLGRTPERPDFFEDLGESLATNITLDSTEAPEPTLPTSSDAELHSLSIPSTPPVFAAASNHGNETHLPTPLPTPSSDAAPSVSAAPASSQRKSGRVPKTRTLYGDLVSTPSVVDADLPTPAAA